ncbi:YihY/virulence factor BrkB family protein [Branchiibius sp. NY16-3462-2]|uniref:YihY/virulence factor BrkB family protein n=1 Tax=Branchiibius sp. NY16-3462-2 TaxID=1807500 RepID=UPI0007991EC6|nr:YihY/virulence factor BrkB family protein [Branchiibius sp. NY16-3462-2]KYH43013.1 hypothetical protein AZH51_06060 [Branchiibius sp. NY16-3462-2]
MSLTRRLDAFQQRHAVLGFPIGVIYKFFDDYGTYLSALVTYYAFVSIFPLLLLASTILSIVLQGHPHLQQELIDSALSEFPVIGDQLKTPQSLSGSWTAIFIGVIVALYGALGAAQAIQYVSNQVWQVPRNNRPNPFVARGKSILIILIMGIGVFGVSLANVIISRWTFLGEHSGLIADAVAFPVIVASIMFIFQLSASSRVRPMHVLPGAIVASVLLRILQGFGASYVSRVVAKSSSVDGVFAIVLGLLAFVYLVAMSLILAMEINVVWRKRLFPRSLLTPFSDNVELTRADRAMYAGRARAQRYKGFQEINVDFEREPDQQ